MAELGKQVRDFKDTFSAWTVIKEEFFPHVMFIQWLAWNGVDRLPHKILLSRRSDCAISRNGSVLRSKLFFLLTDKETDKETDREPVG